MKTHELSWWERVEKPILIENSWWKFWKRYEKGTCSYWHRPSILLTQEESDMVIAASRSGTNNLLEKLIGSRVEMLYGIQLAECAQPNEYIKTFSGNPISIETGGTNLLINTGDVT